MAATCEIEFENNPSKVIYTGEWLNGTVHLTTDEKTIHGVLLKVVGKAKVRWTEGTGRNRATYGGKEKHLEEKTYLVGGSDGRIILLN